MAFYYTLTGLIVSIVAAGSDTIHYTNSPNHLAQGANYTAYKLEVPGTNGITIIEPVDQDDETTEENSTIQGVKKMVYAPDLLQKFMEEYSAKRKSSYDGPNQQEAPESGSHLENRRVTRVKIHNIRKQQLPSSSPFTDKEGWVTLEAVPWSKSKVSKWRPNVVDLKASATMSSVSQYDTNPVRPLDNSHGYYNDNSDGHVDDHFNKNTQKYANRYPDTHKNDGFYDRNDIPSLPRPDRHRPRPRPLRNKDQGYYNTPQPEQAPQLDVSPNYDKWYDYGFRPDPVDSRPEPNKYYTSSSETPKPPRKAFLTSHKVNSHRDEIPNRGTYSPNGYNFQPDPDHDYVYDRDHDYSYQDRPESSYPLTHPASGNGEWVLVSSTKGYQYPSRRQRGITFDASPTPSNSSPTPSNYSVRTHKSIRLTVLPAKDSESNEVPMSTSHGGLLEVDSSHQTIENSVLDAKRKRHTRGSRFDGMQGVRVENESKPDSTAVLAAVSAGMVPATVAMFMPMLGRRKRDIRPDVHLLEDRLMY